MTSETRSQKATQPPAQSFSWIAEPFCMTQGFPDNFLAFLDVTMFQAQLVCFLFLIWNQPFFQEALISFSGKW